MAASIAGARGICVGTAHYVDLALELPPSPYSRADQWHLLVADDGVFAWKSSRRTNVQLLLDFPSLFRPAGRDARRRELLGRRTAPSSATLDDVAASEERALDLRVTGYALGSFPVTALLTADDDLLTGNNSGTRAGWNLQSGVDLGVTVTVNPTNVFVTEAVDYTVDLTSYGTLAFARRNAFDQYRWHTRSSRSLPDPVRARSTRFANWVLDCQLADVASPARRRASRCAAALIRSAPRTAVAQLNLPNDTNSTNNEAEVRALPSARSAKCARRVSTEELRAVVGTTYELTYTLNALGRLPAQNARFLLQQPPLGVIESVVAGSVTCVDGPEFTTCDFGTLNPGDVRTVVVRFHMTASASHRS